MPKKVITDALLECDKGTSSEHTRMHGSMLKADGTLISATDVIQNRESKNLCFCSCTSLGNPVVENAQISPQANGIIPQPCIPVVSVASHSSSTTCQCLHGGLISVRSVGQTVIET